MEEAEAALTAVTMVVVPVVPRARLFGPGAGQEEKECVVVKESHTVGYHEPANSKSGFF